MTAVLDASALATAMLGTSDGARSLRRRLAEETTHAPHLVEAEVGNVLRRRSLRGEIAAGDAEMLLAAGARLVDHRHEMTGALARAAWSMREHVTFYDGLYVALAAALECALLTSDSRLARAHALPCVVEHIAAR